MKTREERRARQRECMVRITFVCMLLLAFLAVLAALITPVDADTQIYKKHVREDGRLPGDDVPATARCFMTEEEVERAENEMIEAALLARATRIDNVTVTHYDCCVECCGKTDGITAGGVRATPGVTVAVDPSVIPLGADVLVDYGDGDIKYYRADDVGGAVKGNHIDLCVSNHQEAIELGRKTATVWWVIPE